MTPKKLSEWRRRYGYSQVELARILGVRNESVSRWERGTREIPSFLHLALIGVLSVHGNKRRKKTDKPMSQLDLIDRN
jgi:DNA-binding transcriptional regulator YiaG